MIVYRENKKQVDVAECLADLRRLTRAGTPDQDAVTDWLIQFGLLEAGIADAQNATVDATSPVSIALRNANLVLGHLFFHSSQDKRELGDWVGKFGAALESLGAFALPDTISEGVPEGYAYYSLYPEMYMQAALDFIRMVDPNQVVVIGLRNIGTSLSAVVASTCEEHGIPVHSYTVRPRGHPFDRRLALDNALAGEWRAKNTARFAVVDEGPGLSGSSFAAVVEALAGLGVPESHIVLFPSWKGDAARFVSAAARQHWNRHVKYACTFENVILPRGPFGGARPHELLDLSGGKWRHLVYRSESDYPAVQPQHEMRKYLSIGARPTLYKFAGLGCYGKAKLARAEKLAAAGFAPPPIGLARGFLATQFVQGRPASLTSVDREMLDVMAAYLAFVERNCSVREPISFDALLQMIDVNVSEGLGPGSAGGLRVLERFRSRISDARPVALDGRMLAQEWLQTAGGWLKTDSLDHHDDHFFPGSQNTAWDLAATCIEFGLDRNGSEYLLERYRTLAASDPGLEDRLAFYRVAYLSFRLGYATLAEQSVGDARERERFRRLVGFYTSCLKRELEQTYRRD